MLGLRAIKNLVAHPLLSYAKSCEPGLTERHIACAARLKLAAWVRPGAAGSPDRAIPLSKLSFFHQSEIKLAIAKLIVDLELPAKGKLSVTIYGAYEEASNSRYGAEVTGFEIEGIAHDFVFLKPLLFGL